MTEGRTYVRVHDGMDDHPKIEGLSDAAKWAFMRCMFYCSRNLTDGRMTETAWRNRAKTPKVRRELIDAGLVHDSTFNDDCPTPPKGHVQMHDYLDWQRSAQEVADLRTKRSEAGRRGGRAKANGQASAKQMLEQTPSKNVADTDTDTDTDTYKNTAVGGVSHVSRGEPEHPPLYPNHCPRHAHQPVPGNCGDCADTRKANAARPPALYAVSQPMQRCLIHDQSFERTCNGCEADRKGRKDAG